MGTITTYRHCAVKDGIAYIGTKADIVAKVYKFRIDEERKLWALVPGYKESVHAQYGDSWTFEEMYADAIKELYGRLTAYRFDLFRDVDGF